MPFDYNYCGYIKTKNGTAFAPYIFTYEMYEPKLHEIEQIIKTANCFKTNIVPDDEPNYDIDQKEFERILMGGNYE